MTTNALRSEGEFADEVLPFGQESLSRDNAEVHEFAKGKNIEYADAEVKIVFQAKGDFWEGSITNTANKKIIEENATVNKVELLYQVSGDQVYFTLKGITVIGNDIFLKKIVSREQFAQLFGFEVTQKQNPQSNAGVSAVTKRIGDLVTIFTRKK